MKPERIIDAIGNLDDKRIQSAQRPGHITPLWVRWSAAAACFVLVIAAACFALLPKQNDESIIYAPSRFDKQYSAVYLAAPNYPEELVYPEEDDYNAISDWQLTKQEVAIGSADIPIAFLKESAATVLSGSKENTAFSPISLYMALSMLAETAEGESRTQILKLLRADDIETLRQDTKQLWQKHYNGDGRLALQLSNALFLNNRQSYHKETVDILAADHYASVLRGKMGSPEYNTMLQEWISKNTGGMLDDNLENYTTEEDLSAILTSTIYFRGKWSRRFQNELNTLAPFYAADGEREVEYMNKTAIMPYYMSENYTAVRLDFVGNGSMWLIKPDEGVSVEEVISEGKLMGVLSYRSFISQYGDEAREPKVILSLPKFDCSVSNDLVTPLQKMGVTDVFDPAKADLSALIADVSGGYVSAAKQDVRVCIDEEGCKAAAVTIFSEAEAAISDTIPEVVEFTLDHPFLYVIVSEFGEPLFAGTIQNP